MGLGVMGRAMAGNLARRYPVTGYDVNETRFQGLAGVTRAGTLLELARHCTVVCLSLPDAKIVEEVAIGDKGLVHGLRQGSLVIDFSTSLPAVSRRIAARFAESGLQFADAPVSGGKGAQNRPRSPSWWARARRLSKDVSPFFPPWGKQRSAWVRQAPATWQSWSIT